MFVHECRQLWREGARDYVTDWWNWMDSALILFYLAYYGLQMVLYIKVYNSSDLNRLHICPNISHHTTCRYMTCMADRALSNITYCSGKSNCDYIDDLYSPKSRGKNFHNYLHCTPYSVNHFTDISNFISALIVLLYRTVSFYVYI